MFKIIRNNELVKHDDNVAQKFTEISELVVYEKGQKIFSQDQKSTGYLYLILSGRIDLLIDNRFITSIEGGQTLDEYPLLKHLPHTVTAYCQEKTVIARISEIQFQSITDDYPILWRNLAEALTARLHEVSVRFAESKVKS